MFKPKIEALAFRIWAHCEPLGWDTDARQIADAMDETVQRVTSICAVKGWTDRLRPAPKKRRYYTPMQDTFAGIHAGFDQ